MENGTKEFHAILVRGGETGKKLHVASNGTSSLGCGHWTKRHITAFEVADNVRKETLDEFAGLGNEMCEKCFPQYLDTSKVVKHSGPKFHLLKMRDYRIEDGKLIYRKSQGSECGRRNMWDVSTFNTFSKMVEESPEGCCTGCTKRLNEIKQSLNLN